MNVRRLAPRLVLLASTVVASTAFAQAPLGDAKIKALEASIEIISRNTSGGVQGTRSLILPPNALFSENDILSSLNLSGAFGPLEINVTNGIPVIAISRVYSNNGTSAFFESRPVD